eukprot:m.36910 g.36910  ORF g.36910 m.36910 type:complete len:96 (-) comp5804_c0_seq1:203-490(-)
MSLPSSTSASASSTSTTGGRHDGAMLSAQCLSCLNAWVLSVLTKAHGDCSGMLSCEDIAQAVANPDPEPQIPLAEMRTSSFEMLPLSSNALLDTQ